MRTTSNAAGTPFQLSTQQSELRFIMIALLLHPSIHVLLLAVESTGARNDFDEFGSLHSTKEVNE